MTGTTLSATARFQINIKLPHVTDFSALSKVNTTVIPILWLEEGRGWRSLGRILLEF